MVSVIIPAYNRANIIAVSIRSVLAQTYSNLEVIVVDDASEDDTCKVVKSINDTRVRYIRHGSNLGGAASRNTGIRYAEGEYIAFLDSDDVFFPDKLERQIYSVLQSCEPDNTVSYTQALYSEEGITENIFDVEDENNVIPRKGKLCDETVAEYLFCSNGKMISSTLMLHRSLALKVQFREDFKKHQDWDFCLRLEAKGAIFSFVDAPLTLWNGDPSLDHVGRSEDYSWSEFWLQECRPYISHRAFTSFYVEKILPHLMKSGERRLFTQRILLVALQKNLISPKSFLKKSVRVWV